jgi:hypothetical protein
MHRVHADMKFVSALSVHPAEARSRLPRDNAFEFFDDLNGSEMHGTSLTRLDGRRRPKLIANVRNQVSQVSLFRWRLHWELREPTFPRSNVEHTEQGSRTRQVHMQGTAQ